MLLLSALSPASSSLAARCPPPTLLCAANTPPIPAALQDALGDERAKEVWDRRPPGALPNDRKQAALVEWLSTSPLAADPERYLYPCLRREPKLLLKASSLPALRESHAALSQLLKEEDAPSQFVQAIAHEPALLLATEAGLYDAAAVIGRVTNLEGASLARLLRREPSLLLLSPESIERRCTWLRERLGIEAGGRLTRVLSRSPLILLASISTFEARLHLLTDELGVPEDGLGALVVRSPKLLHSPLKELRSRASWLESSGIVGAGSSLPTIAAFLARQPDYFSISPRACKERLGWLEEDLGVGRARAASILATEPAILSSPIDQLQLRASFFLQVVGGTLDELVLVPHMLTCDLAKVPMLRQAYCLAYGLRVSPAQLLTKGDAAFCDSVDGCNLEDLNEFEREGKHLSFFQGAEV